jgi:hypothetical protein
MRAAMIAVAWLLSWVSRCRKPELIDARRVTIRRRYPAEVAGLVGENEHGKST